MSDFLLQFAKIFPELNVVLGAGIMVLARILGLFRFAPVFNRKEIPAQVRIALAFIMAIIATMVLKPTLPPGGTSIALCIILNYAFGAIIGFVANCILAAIAAGGDMLNTQMGLSAASVTDPTTRTQVSIIGNCFSVLGMLIFIQAGGIYWLFDAFLRSFDVFSMYSTSFALTKIINIDYLVTISANVLFMGMQIAAPVLLATLGQDIILGIISKTAPQVNVFQLSFLFKPVMGCLILIWILPMLMNVIHEYVVSYARIF